LKTLKISESKRIEATWDNATERVGTEAKIAMIAHYGHSKDSLPSISTHPCSGTIRRAAQQRLAENNAEPV
jgi:3-phosphoglycerate kinase